MAVTPPRPSATIILARDGATGVEVFMLERHRQIEFASGAWVFPGGCLEPDDESVAANDDLCASHESDHLQRALRVAAIRETFEECGVLLARRRGEIDYVNADDRAHVSQALIDGLSFGGAIERCGLELALDALTSFAHWVTPSQMAKRYDTHFYIAKTPPDQIAEHEGVESSASLWANPRHILQQARNGAHTIIFPTRMNLKILNQTSVAEAIAAAQARKILRIEPEPIRHNGAVALKIPLEAGYGGEIFLMEESANKK